MVATTHTHTRTLTEAHQVFNINPNITKTYEQTAGRQQKVILEECLCLINSLCSELFGPVIRGSPWESLGAGWRSCDPWDHWCSRAGSYLGTHTLLPERSKI